MSGVSEWATLEGVVPCVSGPGGVQPGVCQLRQPLRVLFLVCHTLEVFGLEPVSSGDTFVCCSLCQVLEVCPELRELVRQLGRGGGKGPMRKAPEEVGLLSQGSLLVGAGWSWE